MEHLPAFFPLPTRLPPQVSPVSSGAPNAAPNLEPLMTSMGEGLEPRGSVTL